MMKKNEMKNLFYTIYVLTLVVSTSAIGQTSIMSYNIRYDNPNDNENSWQHRKVELSQMINHYSPEIIGIQEGLVSQIKYLDSILINYSYIGVGRDDGINKGEYAAIFYNKNYFKLLSTKTYWLSETPDTISVGWDASMERIVTFGEFEDIRTKDTMYVFNCHFDHIGKTARIKSAELILKIIELKGIQQNKIIVLGDLNCEPDDKPMSILKKELNDSYDISQNPPYGPTGTFNNFDLGILIEKRIDYILTKNIKTYRYSNIDDRRKNNLFLSDHLPIIVKIE